MPWIEANGASLRYELGGAGKGTLVLVHEAGGCLESYEEALPALEKAFRVLRYDQRGFGFSEKARTLTFDGVVADLAALLDALGIREPVLLAGCAMGADFSAGFAARHPRRVARLVLASPLAGSNAGRSGPMLERAALVEREGVRASMAASHERSYPEVLRALVPGAQTHASPPPSTVAQIESTPQYVVPQGIGCTGVLGQISIGSRPERSWTLPTSSATVSAT